MTDRTGNTEMKTAGKGRNTLLFFANWLFALFLSKWLISSPEGDLDFLLKNIGTFLVVAILTGLMIRFSSKRIIVVLIPAITILALALAFRS